MDFYPQLSKHQQFFATGQTKALSWRIAQLKQIKKLVTENEKAISQALADDLAKPALESFITEISYIASDVDHMIKGLKKWSKPRRVTTSLVAQPGRSFVKPEPQGTVLIIGAWNYPLQLVLAPLIAVLAAGNCAILKPSELAPATSQLLARLVPDYLAPEAVSVVEGAIAETTALLTLPFDHIMYTGNGQVARIIMAAAAKHLTPITLELGGKSPVFIDRSANMAITAKRLAWGKWMNAGQTCIAPDYVITTKDILPELIDALEKEIQQMFGDDPQQSKSYGRIVNQRHTERISGYLSASTPPLNVIYGGDVQLEHKYIAPTLVLNPPADSPLMTEEIFGPILPIITLDNIEQAITFVQHKDKPLAAYLFSSDKQQQELWVEQISAGSICLNDVIMFNAVPELPFGGTGPSGMGQYSGKAGFDNFSHLKAVLKRPFINDLPVRFAPYTKWKFALMRFIRKL